MKYESEEKKMGLKELKERLMAYGEALEKGNLIIQVPLEEGEDADEV